MEDAMTEIEKTIDAWTQADREIARAILMQQMVGAFKLDTEDNWCVRLEAEVGPGCTGVASQCPQVIFEPRKLVILQPSVMVNESIEHFEQKEQIIGPWWRSTKQVVPSIVRRETVQRFVEIPRGIWQVQTLLVGQKVQLPTYGTISGDLFGPDGTLGFIDTCQMALSISVCVRNTGTQMLPFHAVVLGKAHFEKTTEPA